MPSSSYSIDSEMLSTTLQPVAKNIRDGYSVNLGFTKMQEKFLGKASPYEEGGSVWIQGMQTAEHAGATNLSGAGDQRIDLGYQGIIEDGQVKPDSVGYPVIITKEERAQNSGAGKLIDLAEMRVKAQMAKAKRRHSLQIGTGGVSEYVNHLTLNGSSYSTGLFEPRAFGSQTNTVLGLSRSTYASVPVMNHHYGTISNDFNANGYAILTRLDIAMRNYAIGDSSKRAWLVSLLCLENLKTAIRAFERYTTKDALDAGRLDGIAWNGVPVEPWSHLTGAGSASVAMSALCVDFEAIHMCWSKGEIDGHYSMEDFAQISGEYDGERALIRVRGNLKAAGYSTSGVAFNGETF